MTPVRARGGLLQPAEYWGEEAVKAPSNPSGKPAELHRVNRRGRSVTCSDHKNGWLLDGS
jgi:hypothetical protein